MKTRFTEEQIIGFLKEVDTGIPVEELCRKHGFSEGSYYIWRIKFGGLSEAAEGAGKREHAAQEAAGRVDAG